MNEQATRNESRSTVDRRISNSEDSAPSSVNKKPEVDGKDIRVVVENDDAIEEVKTTPPLAGSAGKGGHSPCWGVLASRNGCQREETKLVSLKLI